MTADTTPLMGTDREKQMRQEFEMSEEDLKGLLEACRPVPMIALQCGPVSSPQENANRAWCALGDRMGFDGMTVHPSRKGQRFFTAETKPAAAPPANTSPQGDAT